MAIVAAGSVVTLAAQARPDFSGRWTSDSTVAESGRGAGRGGRGAAAGEPGRRGGGAARGRTGDMGSGWGPTITIAQDAKRLTVEYAFFSRGDLQPPLAFTYALDGSETRNALMMGRGIQEPRSTAVWDGDRLVITTSETFADPGASGPVSSVETRVLQLESPTTLLVEVTRKGVLGGSDSTTRTVYRKAS
jgi:hypothetical protein